MAEKKEKRIIEMTPFIFEDGKSYYFSVDSRGSQSYHNLFVYEKVETVKRSFFGKKIITEDFLPITDPVLINTDLDKADIKGTIKRCIMSTKVVTHIKDWDGFVGDVPENIKASLKRDSKLKNILGD